MNDRSRTAASTPAPTSVWTPDRMLETSGAYRATCALHGALALDLFTRIGDARANACTVATDAVWMSHILHAESAASCLGIIAKAFDCLNPGGRAVIHEFNLNDTLDGPLFPALFSLNMLLGTEAGRAYSQAQLAGMLKSAGFVDIQRLDFTGTHDSGPIRGIKPA